MHIKLHANAATTPRIRKYIQQSTKTVAELARELGLGQTTARRWKRRTDAHDRSSCPHHLQTTLSSSQEAIVVQLRTTLLLSLDDLLVVVRRFINAACSRAGLDRCLRRNGVSNLRQLIPACASHADSQSSHLTFLPGHSSSCHLISYHDA